MASPIRRGQVGTQVSDLTPNSNSSTPTQQTSFFVPYGLTLRQTITSSGSVSIPSGITWVYVVMTGAGGGGSAGGGGGGGALSWGWTLASNTCIIGTSSAGIDGGFTRYGHIIAGGGGRGGNSSVPTIGAAGGGGQDTQNAGSNGVAGFYGQPAGSSSQIRATIDNYIGGGAPGGAAQYPGWDGGSGVIGGGGSGGHPTSGNGGSGVIGGGGGRGVQTNSTGGNGGSGMSLYGEFYSGGLANGREGGSGAGFAGAGTNGIANGAPGGLGGGGGGAGTASASLGGNGILYIFY